MEMVNPIRFKNYYLSVGDFVEEKAVDELQKNAKEYYEKWEKYYDQVAKIKPPNHVEKPKGKEIEKEQLRFISLLYKFGLKIVGINIDIKNSSGKPLTDLDAVVYLDNTMLIFGVKNQTRNHFPNLEQFSGVKKDLSKYIEAKYGKTPTTEYKFVYYDAKADTEEGKHMIGEVTDITVLFKEDVDYFFKICKIEYRLARNDFLSTLKIKYKSKAEARTAIKYDMEGINVYMLFVSPKDLFSCVVIPRKRNLTSGLSAFQRSIDEQRLKNIADYIIEPTTGFAFPNTILLASDNKLVDNEILTNEKGEKSDRWGTSAVSLNFPIDYGVLKLIDGQHRLLGYAKITDGATQEDRRFPILILEGLPDNRKAKVFLDINSKFKPVDPNLKLLIASEISWPSRMRKEIREKDIVNLILRLINEKIISEDEIFLGHAGVERIQDLNLRTVVSAIKTSKIDQIATDPFSDLTKLINKLKQSKNKDFYLKNIGFRILCRIIGRCFNDSPEEPQIETLFNDLIDSLDKLSNLTQLGYGEKGAKDRADELMLELKKKFGSKFGYLKVEAKKT